MFLHEISSFVSVRIMSLASDLKYERIFAVIVVQKSMDNKIIKEYEQIIDS